MGRGECRGFGNGHGWYLGLRWRICLFMSLGGRTGGGVGGSIWSLLIICHVLSEMFCSCLREGVPCALEKIYWQFYKDAELRKLSC